MGRVIVVLCRADVVLGRVIVVLYRADVVLERVIVVLCRVRVTLGLAEVGWGFCIVVLR